MPWETSDKRLNFKTVNSKSSYSMYFTKLVMLSKVIFSLIRQFTTFLSRYELQKGRVTSSLHTTQHITVLISPVAEAYFRSHECESSISPALKCSYWLRCGMKEIPH